MKLIDSIVDKIAPGHDHGLDDYLIVDPDELETGDENDVVVLEGVPDEDDVDGS